MHIDLNADLGEGGALDAELLALVSSANISCGAHAGDESDIRVALQLAKKNGVCIGAHPSYPDRANMGRVAMKMSADQLQQSLLEQLTYLQNLAHDAAATVHFVKPHGALYNQAARDLTLARQVARAVKSFDASLTLVGLAGSQLLRAGHEAGIKTCAEAFVDRAYQADGSLLPRSCDGAVIEDTEVAMQQAMSIITEQRVQTHDGKMIPIVADTLCVHGDTPQALAFAQALHLCLGDTGILIRACH
ncbi:MAG TPA: LamB/YcsF family protein [Pseudohongiella sp.]|nr:5-oxoprolinase subunit PxpA [Pseudohongiella sp.]HDZ10501.1 LamB/YcsF family protein [Pseudohongiella sp.]HEA63864.1 LamB/YcsF family protein [Pseudohongiella sp.]